MPIALENIVKSYGRDNRILHNLNFKVEDGDFVAVVGPSGCGKTTLLNLIGGLDRPDEGRVLVSGRNLGQLNDQELSQFRNRTVGFIFQLNWLHPRLNAFENVMLPALVAGVETKQAHESAREQLALVGLKDFARRFPGELSGGQVQRVAIARSLVMSPPILLADEPTGNLDQKTGEEILGLIRILNQERGLTVLLVTHEPAIRQYARRTVQMEHGRFVENSKDRRA